MGELAVGIKNEAGHIGPGFARIDATLALALERFVGRSGVAVGRETVCGLNVMGGVAFRLDIRTDHTWRGTSSTSQEACEGKKDAVEAFGGIIVGDDGVDEGDSAKSH